MSARWQKSSRCESSDCLEARWQKSSRCGGGNCVEGRHLDGLVQIRDTKLGELSPVLAFEPPAWQSFIDDIKAGALA